MNVKELVFSVSSETGVPAAQVRKVTNSILEKFAELIDNQDVFTSPVITFQASKVSAKEGNPDQPERKVARMQRRIKKG
jgi:hypothetical protein